MLDMIKSGKRAVMLYVIQRSDGTIFKPAYDIDPVYGKSLKEVHQQGIEILAYRADVTPERIELTTRLEFEL